MSNLCHWRGSALFTGGDDGRVDVFARARVAGFRAIPDAAAEGSDVEHASVQGIGHDAEGYLWYRGRSDDVINSAGYRIGPIEVEHALVEHPAVQACAVVGSPDTERGEIVKAFVVLRDGITQTPELTRELQDHVKTVTAPYKYPRAIAYIDELPMTITGKIRRRELRDLELA